MGITLFIFIILRKYSEVNVPIYVGVERTAGTYSSVFFLQKPLIPCRRNINNCY